ncbi:hypothetical protein HDU83_005286 [Entophlyctis luteolus]|nr:hypothetical protein HDU83_005286 [Entophlyctis luteolus]
MPSGSATTPAEAAAPQPPANASEPAASASAATATRAVGSRGSCTSSSSNTRAGVRDRDDSDSDDADARPLSAIASPARSRCTSTRLSVNSAFVLSSTQNPGAPNLPPGHENISSHSGKDSFNNGAADDDDDDDDDVPLSTHPSQRVSCLSQRPSSHVSAEGPDEVAATSGFLFGSTDNALIINSPSAGEQSVHGVVVVEEAEEDDCPLSEIQMSPIKPRASKDYVLGSDGDLAKEGGGKYSYARPGTLLHEAPQLIAHEKKKRPLDGRYGKPLIAVEVADRNRLEHAKIAGSLAYTTMIRAQEEQAIRSKREENAFKRQNCDKCEGRGFTHPKHGAKIHDRAPNVECKACRVCAPCFGTGLLIDVTSCIDCQSLGYVHPNEPYSCRNAAKGPCEACIACKTCRGTGIVQTQSPDLRLSVQSLTASIASLALKKSKKHNNSTSSFNLRLKRASAVSERIDSVSMLFDEAASLEISGNDLQLPAELVAPDVILETATEASDSEDADESSTDTSSAEEDSAEISQPLVALEHDAEIAKAMQETELGSGATLPAEENQDIAAEQRDKRSELALPSVVSTEYKNEESVASQSPFVTVAMKDSSPVDLADDAVVSSIGLYDSEHPDFSEFDTFKCPSLDRDLTEIANGKYPTSTTVTQKQRTY